MMFSDAQPGFDAFFELRDGSPRVVVRGEIDASTAERFEKRMIEAVGAGAPPVVVDMSAVRFMDSTGLSVIVRTIEALGTERDPSQLIVLSPSASVMKTLSISGIHQLVTIVEPPAPPD